VRPHERPDRSDLASLQQRSEILARHRAHALQRLREFLGALLGLLTPPGVLRFDHVRDLQPGIGKSDLKVGYCLKMAVSWHRHARGSSLPLADSIAVEQRVRGRGALDPREADEVVHPKAQLAAEPRLDAGNAEIVIPAQTELALPDLGAEHAVVAGLDDVDAAVEALVAGDLPARPGCELSTIPGSRQAQSGY
jgi:hypothetical protein